MTVTAVPREKQTRCNTTAVVAISLLAEAQAARLQMLCASPATTRSRGNWFALDRQNTEDSTVKDDTEMDKTPAGRSRTGRCLFGHKWEGCCCTRCDTVRDRDHDWDHCRCKRCGMLRQSDHDWVGCVCRVCGKTNHAWVEGVCRACGATCTHAELSELGDEAVNGPTTRVRRFRICPTCGARVALE